MTDRSGCLAQTPDATIHVPELAFALGGARAIKRKRGRPTGVTRRRRARADAVYAALPEQGRASAFALAETVGMTKRAPAFQSALALLLREGRIERPRRGYYARLGHDIAEEGLPERILRALDGCQAIHYLDLVERAGAPSRASLVKSLRNLRRAGKIDRLQPGFYVRSGVNATAPKADSVHQRLLRIFSDGETHATGDLVRQVSRHAATTTVRTQIKTMARNGEIVSTSHGYWCCNDGRATPRPRLGPNRARLLSAVADLEDGWSRQDLLAALAKRGDPMPRTTVWKILYQVKAERLVETRGRGRYIAGPRLRDAADNESPSRFAD